MKSLSLHPYRDEMLATRAAAESAPSRTPRPFRPVYPGVSAAVLPWLRAADTSWAALGMRQPPAPHPLPGIATIAYLSAVSVAIRVDHAVHQDTLHVIDDIRALLDGRPELLAPLADAVKAGVSL